MKSIYKLVALVIVFLTSFLSSHAQVCQYTSRANGNWTDPNTWTVVRTSMGGGTCATTPSATTNTIIINHNVILNTNASVSNSSASGITINSSGSLVEDATARTLTIGSNAGALSTLLTANGSFTVSNLILDKSNSIISRNSTVRCTLSQDNNATVTINALLTVLGNYNLNTGSVTAGGNGQLDIRGCVTGTNGALNSAIQAPLVVCVNSPNASTGCGTGTCNGNIPVGNSTNCQTILLPITLVKFAGRSVSLPESRENAKVTELTWTTANETDNKLFTVERSADGTDFQEVGMVQGAGTSSLSRDYKIYDHTPFEGITYYRLKQIDFDNSFSYSKIIQVATTTNLTIFPNPIEAENKKITIYVKSTSYLSLTIDIVDINGRIICSKVTDKLVGNVYHVTLPESASRGVYFAHIQINGQVQTHKILIL